MPANKPTIQQAIDAATDGDVIIVSPGTYHEPIDFDGKAITVTTEAGAATTILDGDYSRTIVTFQRGETTNSVLSGFTLRRGFGSYAGAIALIGSSAQISSNVFEANWQPPTGFGAGIAGDGASPLIDHNVFRNNHADSQNLSGIVSFLNDSSPVIGENLFTSNDLRAVNLVLTENNHPRVLNNLFFGNSIALRLLAAETITNAMFRDNIFVQNGVGCLGELVDEDALRDWKNNLLFANGSNYSGLDDRTGGSGNISADPLFACSVRGDFHLLPGSPCIDSGDNIITKTLYTDFDGQPRNVDGTADGISRVDMGPFEFDPTMPRPACVYVVCPQNITVRAAPGAQSIPVSYTTPSANPGASIISSPVSGATFRAGTNLVTCIASSGTNSAVCSFFVTVLAAPANDDFGFATLISRLPYTNSQDTTLATIGPDDMFCGGAGPSVWYRLTARQDEDIYVDGQQSDYPVSVSVYTGERGHLTQAGCAFGLLKIRGARKQTYYIMFSPFFSGSGGNLKLSVRAVPRLAMDIQISDVGFYDARTGQMSIGGTVSTTRPARVRIAGSLSQNRKRQQHPSASFQLTTSCSGTSKWRVIVPKASVRFDGGPAEVDLAAFAFDADAGDSADAQISTSVRLSAGETHSGGGDRDNDATLVHRRMADVDQ